MKALTIFMGLMFFSVASSGAFFGKDDDPVKKAEKVEGKIPEFTPPF